MTNESHYAHHRSLCADSLKEEVLLSFRGQTQYPIQGPWSTSKTSQARVDITFEDATRNILVTGATGSGKTVSVMEPALKRLIDTGCSGLVLTSKPQDLGVAIAHPEQCRVVGGSRLCTPVNLIADLPGEILVGILDRFRANTQSRDRHWGSRGLDYALFVYETYRLMGREPTLACIHNALASTREFVEEFDPWFAQRDPSELPESYRTLLTNIQNDFFNILAHGGSMHVQQAQHPRRRDEAMMQYTWHTGPILTVLRPFAMEDRLRLRLCNPQAGALDFQRLLYDEPTVVFSDIPPHEFGQNAAVVNEILRILMRNAVLRETRHQELGMGESRFTFLVADEFQSHVHLQAAGTGGGLLDDNTWFDRSREYGHINIVATQGLSSLYAQLPPETPSAAVESLFQNLGTMIAFSSHDRKTLNAAGDHLYGPDAERIRQLVASSLATGEAAVLSRSLSRHGGAVAAHVRNTPIFGAPHMTYGHSRHERKVPTDRYDAPAAARIVEPAHPKRQGQRLVEAVEAHDVAGVEAALVVGASPNTRAEDGESMLMAAVDHEIHAYYHPDEEHSHKHIMELLLAYGADPDVPAGGGWGEFSAWTPWQVAEYFDRPDLARRLRAHRRMERRHAPHR
ncbi:hypothetical protein [Halorhodospira halophila]|uniref:hypothetical protein n=1 Tax=Halorhodospira halophila TaxID=1053 RepID=UPI0019148E80|nr:hypothetical protein [Halorhodospira halophila]MBK5937270.1 hypothetical protein [Halorhodospira halophila]